MPHNSYMKSRDSIAGDSAVAGGRASPSRELGNLVAAVRAAANQPGDWAHTTRQVAAALRPRLPSPAILTSEQRYGDPLSYRCHLLHAEPDGSFSVLAVVWRPGQETAVHDHVTWCVAAVIQGAEYEEQFELGADGWLTLTGTAQLSAGQVAGFAPPGDIHRVRNIGSEATISVHVYGTDIRRLGSSVRRIYQQPIVAG
jgi:predicted metal-dependent enzyme (double-stranded beta helix superfamily)